MPMDFLLDLYLTVKPPYRRICRVAVSFGPPHPLPLSSPSLSPSLLQLLNDYPQNYVQPSSTLSFPRALPPQEQIRAYVYDVVRATLPRMFLDEAFEAKDDIAHAVKASLQTCMGTYGYSILVSVPMALLALLLMPCMPCSSERDGSCHLRRSRVSLPTPSFSCLTSPPSHASHRTPL